MRVQVETRKLREGIKYLSKLVQNTLDKTLIIEAVGKSLRLTVGDIRQYGILDIKGCESEEVGRVVVDFPKFSKLLSNETKDVVSLSYEDDTGLMISGNREAMMRDLLIKQDEHFLNDKDKKKVLTKISFTDEFPILFYLTEAVGWAADSSPSKELDMINFKLTDGKLFALATDGFVMAKAEYPTPHIEVDINVNVPLAFCKSFGAVIFQPFDFMIFEDCVGIKQTNKEYSFRLYGRLYGDSKAIESASNILILLTTTKDATEFILDTPSFIETLKRQCVFDTDGVYRVKLLHDNDSIEFKNAASSGKVREGYVDFNVVFMDKQMEVSINAAKLLSALQFAEKKEWEVHLFFHDKYKPLQIVATNDRGYKYTSLIAPFG